MNPKALLLTDLRVYYESRRLHENLSYKPLGLQGLK